MTVKRITLIVGGLTLFVCLFLLFDPPPQTSGEDPLAAPLDPPRPRVVHRTMDRRPANDELELLRTATVRYSIRDFSSNATHEFSMALPSTREGSFPARPLTPLSTAGGEWEVVDVLPGDHSLQILEQVGREWRIIRVPVPGVTDQEVRELGELSPAPTKLTVRISTEDGSPLSGVRLSGGLSLADKLPHLIRGPVPEDGVVEVSGIPPGEVVFDVNPARDSGWRQKQFRVVVGERSEVSVVLERKPEE